MSTPVETKRIDRFRLLQTLYDILDGVADTRSIDIRTVGREFGMDDDYTINTFEYLKNEGLTKWAALGGMAAITHAGVREVEDARERKATPHFPANIVIVSDSPGSQVIAGTDIQAVQSSRSDNASEAARLRMCLESVMGSNLPNEAAKLLEQAEKDNPDRIALAQHARDLAEKDPRWNTALRSFATTASAHATGGLLVEAIKFATGV